MTAESGVAPLRARYNGEPLARRLPRSAESVELLGRRSPPPSRAPILPPADATIRQWKVRFRLLFGRGSEAFVPRPDVLVDLLPHRRRAMSDFVEVVPSG